MRKIHPDCTIPYRKAKPAWWLVVLVGLFLLPFAALADDSAMDPARVEMLAGSCAPCHGTEGASQGPTIPSLAGQPKDYFIQSMRAFQNGKRPATVMDRLVAGYDDNDLLGMGQYFATKKAIPQSQPSDAARLKRGTKLAYERCRTCHVDGRLWRQYHENRGYDKACSRSCHLNYGPDGKDETPVLGGQWSRYLELQMDDFRQGRRPMSERKAKAFRSLTDDDLKALAAFYASLTEPRR